VPARGSHLSLRPTVRHDCACFWRLDWPAVLVLLLGLQCTEPSSFARKLPWLLPSHTFQPARRLLISSSRLVSSRSFLTPFPIRPHLPRTATSRPISTSFFSRLPSHLTTDTTPRLGNSLVASRRIRAGREAGRQSTRRCSGRLEPLPAFLGHRRMV